MQIAFGFSGSDDLSWIEKRLAAWLGRSRSSRQLSPIGQLVKSSISSRTRDEVSWAAYCRLVERYPNWSDLAAASITDIEAVIADVTFPEVKARNLVEMLSIISAERPDYDLSFLAEMSVKDALAWLERLPGVGRKVAASTLNFSVIAMPAFVIDTHILRVLCRFGLVRAKADTRTAYDAFMGNVTTWSAGDLVEFHRQMKRLGQLICQAGFTDCLNCPIQERCLYGRRHALPPHGYAPKILPGR